MYYITMRHFKFFGFTQPNATVSQQLPTMADQLSVLMQQKAAHTTHATNEQTNKCNFHMTEHNPYP